MREIFFTLILILVASNVIVAQEFIIEGNLQLANPQGEYKESIDRVGFGVNLNAFYRFKNTPLSTGLDFNFMNFGVDSREEPISSNIPDLRVRVENSYNLFQLFVKGKIQPPSGFLRPYAEGLFGFNYFFTETTISERNNSSSDPIASDTNFDDAALAWGGGAGVMIRIADNRNKEPKISEDGNEMISSKTTYINLGIRYLSGKEAEYLKEGSIQVNNGRVTYETFRSKTDMIIFQLGLGITF
ncbi:hypothetical protein [Gracilimonas sp.]|uniref:hypothetical protein n=1 Tax=Gracilimonas sp. TaxID=1974203 RepID=UPI0032ECFCA3